MMALPIFFVVTEDGEENIGLMTAGTLATAWHRNINSLAIKGNW